MRLSDIRGWIKGIIGASPPRMIERAQQTREDRASTVLALRKDVRGLQQEITDISHAAESGGVTTEQTADAARLASLHRRLEQKQAELARYQARI